MTAQVDRAAAALAVPLHQALGARFVDDDPSRGVTFEVGGMTMNPGGTLHGGALGVILEITAFIALLPELSDAEHAVTHHISTQMLSAGQRGEQVLVTATVERRTRRLGFLTATAVIGDRLVARSQITKSVIALR